MSHSSTFQKSKLADEVNCGHLVTFDKAASLNSSDCKGRPIFAIASEEQISLKGALVYSTENLSTKNHNDGTASQLAGQSTSAADLSLNQPPRQSQIGRSVKQHATGTENSNTQTEPTSTTKFPAPSNTIGCIVSTPRKEKMKGASFLSRLVTKGGKKKDHTDFNRVSEKGNLVAENMNANVSSNSVNASGSIPHHKGLPSYTKELCSGKSFNEEVSTKSLPSEIDCQNIQESSQNSKSHGATWAMEFSVDGKFLAAAGREQVIRVWEVLSSPEERQAFESEENESPERSGGMRINAPVFKSMPIREYSDHTGDILDINWSKNNFLLSLSADKMIKLWHPSRQECLNTFTHNYLITSIAFHPSDDRFFLSGSLDCFLGLWSIPEKKVVNLCKSPDPITAVAFTPDGMTAIAGCLSGLCQFFDLDQQRSLKFSNEIYVRSSRGKNAKGSKITGIRTAFFPHDHPCSSDISILITSNDSRIRLYSFKEKRLEIKFQGHENNFSQINASFSDDGRYVICGSEDRKTYIWTVTAKDSDSKEIPSIEIFNTHSSVVMTAILAPQALRRLLSESRDPIYDICNPPPISLKSLNESDTVLPAGLGISCSTVASKTTDLSQAYLAPASYENCPIILTSDSTGSIKCFRVDCTFEKRHHWETSSLCFSKKKSSLRRSNSLLTRTSSSSWQNSLGRPSTPHSMSASISIYSEQILTWNGKVTDECNRTLETGRSTSPVKLKDELNQSPSKSLSHCTNNNTTEQRLCDLPPRIKSSSTTNPKNIKSHGSSCNLPPNPGFSLIDTPKTSDSLKLSNSATKSSSLWNISSWRTSLGSGSSRDLEDENFSGLKHSKDEGGRLSTKLSGVEETYQDDSPDLNEPQLSCKMCDGRNFRARRVSEKGMVMVCVGCGVLIG